MKSSHPADRLAEPCSESKTEVVQTAVATAKSRAIEVMPKETGGPKGLEPTRYGDWEKQGRCIDF